MSGEAASDADLADRARRGDRRAFGALYRRFAPTVHGLLVTLVSRQEAHDLVHDVFAQALQRIDDLREPTRVGAWLCAIARNRGRNARARRRRDEALPEEPAAPADRGVSDDARAAMAALRELPEAYRETLALRLVEGMTGPEIAARTGLTHGSVRVNLSRGMKLLRARLATEGSER